MVQASVSFPAGVWASALPPQRTQGLPQGQLHTLQVGAEEITSPVWEFVKRLRQRSHWEVVGGADGGKQDCVRWVGSAVRRVGSIVGVQGAEGVPNGAGRAGVAGGIFFAAGCLL